MMDNEGSLYFSLAVYIWNFQVNLKEMIKKGMSHLIFFKVEWNLTQSLYPSAGGKLILSS